jgi:hypothetical protein
MDDEFWKSAQYSDQCTIPCKADNTTTCGGNKAYQVHYISGKLFIVGGKQLKGCLK